MTLEDLAEHVRGAVAAQRKTGAPGAAWASYEASSRQWHADPLPLTPEKALGFALAECMRGVSTAQLNARLASLRAYAAGEELPMAGWGPGSTRLLAMGVAALKREFPAEIIRARPMTDEVMRAVRAYLRMYLDSGHVYAHMWWSMLTLAYAGCLRSVSFLDAALSTSDLYISVRGGIRRLEADVAFRKTSRDRKDEGRDRLTFPGRGGTDADLDPLRALESYAAAAGLTIGSGDRPLYERRRRASGQLWPEARPGYSYHSSLKELKWLLWRAGVPFWGSYSWHSLRRGCATRLLARGVPWDVVKKLGAWATDSAMENYDARGWEVADAVELWDIEPARPGDWALARRGSRGREARASSRPPGALAPEAH